MEARKKGNDIFKLVNNENIKSKPAINLEFYTQQKHPSKMKVNLRLSFFFLDIKKLKEPITSSPYYK